jgi:hypothetical protein
MARRSASGNHGNARRVAYDEDEEHGGFRLACTQQ